MRPNAAAVPTRRSVTLALVRTRSSWTGPLAVLLAVLLAVTFAPAAPAGAADQTVVATDKVFTPADVTVLQGESVTWNNGGTLAHNVRFDDNSFVMPPAPDSTPWSVSRTFATVGVFRYYCEAHGYPNGVDMSGAVYVKPAATPLLPGGPQSVFADKTAPRLKLSGSKRQKALRRRALFVRAEVNETASVVARAWISIPKTRRSFRARRVSRQLGARARSKFELRLPRQAVRAFRRALRKHTRLTARVTVVARDPAGNRTLAKRRVRLR
jgi:plastocyanin